MLYKELSLCRCVSLSFPLGSVKDLKRYSRVGLLSESSLIQWQFYRWLYPSLYFLFYLLVESRFTKRYI